MVSSVKYASIASVEMRLGLEPLTAGCDGKEKSRKLLARSIAS
jgi:hypothetical protein